MSARQSVPPWSADRESSPRPVSPAMQDYLKAIYRLRGGGPVTIQRLASSLRISAPSVTNMVKRLTEFGYLNHVRYGDVELTACGERVAREVTRRHRLVELYLVQALGYPPEAAHLEAERLEHHISEDLAARLDLALGHPTRDPHGAPIPISNRERANRMS